MLTKLHRQGQIDVRFKPPYDKLVDIRNHLEKLTLTQAWSLRETDLYSYQRRLDRIDETRVNGNFLDPEGNPADLHAQRVRTLFSAFVYSANQTDATVPTSAELRLHLRTSHLFRASIGGPVTYIQPAPNTATVLGRSQAIGRRLFTTGVVSVQHEGLSYILFPPQPISPRLTHSPAQLNRQHAQRRQVHGRPRHPRGARKRQRTLGRMFRSHIRPES